MISKVSIMLTILITHLKLNDILPSGLGVSSTPFTAMDYEKEHDDLSMQLQLSQDNNVPCASFLQFIQNI